MKTTMFTALVLCRTTFCANEWLSSMPSAWKPSDPNAQVAAVEASARTLLGTVQAAQSAISIADMLSARERDQAVRSAIVGSIEHSSTTCLHLAVSTCLHSALRSDYSYEVMSECFRVNRQLEADCPRDSGQVVDCGVTFSTNKCMAAVLSSGYVEYLNQCREMHRNFLLTCPAQLID